MPDAPFPILAVFASDRGPGSPERASIMSQAGTYFARRGAAILCLEQNNLIPVPLITSARAARGQVTIVAAPDFSPPRALSSVPIQRIENAEERLRYLGTHANGFVGLPGSLASVTALYGSWVRAGGAESGKPVVFVNRNAAFEIIRGFAADVLSHSVSHSERLMQFADTVEDAWARLARLIGEPQAGR